MNKRCILQIALLLCFSTPTLSISYNLLRLQQSNSSLECQKLLMQLNGRPEDCLEDGMNFKIPEEIKHPQQFQKEHAAFVIYEMLQDIFAIFTRDFSKTGWNETIVKDLLAQLHHQMDLLETTLEEKLGEENISWANSTTMLRLKSYYWRILRYLKAKEFSSCAWTVVQSELLRNFSFINRLTDDFQS
ncbi:Interferon beta [Sciurus carolinensis]|uniref:Interferon beta n=1 Tax=Sciurus carolinensis TaxID=30640 RepID=A0AA41MKB0_SCICA|nr:interferon beta [Sciurus carolinensis]MBZ3873384.1 Interferon beta [Sciurus carolinensis]